MTDVAIGVTDAVLAAACGVAAWRSGVAAARVGLGLVGLAATLGTVRFLATDAVAPVHEILVSASTSLGIPAIGAGAAIGRGWSGPRGAGAAMALAGASGGVGALLHVEWVGTALAAVGMSTLLAACGSRRAWPGVAGALLVFVAGLGVAGGGAWGGIPRAAWFHVVMTAAVLGLGEGVRALQPTAPEGTHSA